MKSGLWLSACGGLLISLFFLGKSPAQEKQDPKGNENFTGSVRRLESDIRVRAARIRFEPGARTKWHIHERGQILLCEEGLARTQVQGMQVQELHPGETTYVPGGVPHWHGAAAGQATILFSVDVSAGQTRWLSEVTEAEYRAGPPK